MEAPPGTEARGVSVDTGRRVVIVDDDVECLHAIEEIVKRWGHEVVGFMSFTKARAYFTDATPDIAIVDVRLGDYNGFQLLHLLQQTSPDTMLVAVSGFDDSVLRAEAKRLGAGYLTKPINLTTLRQWLDQPRDSGHAPLS
jgi:two-component system response regulator RegA